MTYLMEMLELHRGNTCIGIETGCNPAEMFAMVHHSLNETDGFMPQAYVCWNRHNMQTEEETAVCPNLLTSTRWVT
jgi:hypothetical protein